MAVVVSDSSPIHALAHLDRLDLLKPMFTEVLIPPAVANELRDPRSGLPPIEVTRILSVRVQAPSDRHRTDALLQSLDPGEAEALSLAIEVGVRRVLIDEAEGRRAVKRLGLKPLGVLGLLVLAKRKRLVPAVLPLMDRLREGIGFFVSPELRVEIARRAGE